MKNLNEDGHTDKPSAIRKLKVSIENAEAIINKLESHDDELMSWWMDKITLANDYLSKAKDFIENPVNEGIFGKFNTGAGFKGNGMTVYDRNQEKAGDYKDIAHIAPNGKITIYDKKVKKEPKLMQSLNKISQEFKKTFKESVNEAYEPNRKGYIQYFKDNKYFRKELIKIEKYSKGVQSYMKRGDFGFATQTLGDIKFQVDTVLEEIADEFDRPDLVDHVLRESPKKQPDYYKGLSKKDKEERERVIKRRSKMDSDDPKAYKGFRSDKGVKTKPSKWNAKFKKMYGELSEENKKVVHEALSAKIKKALKNKAKKSNAPQGVLTTVYNKGLAAWRTGHRPGASQHAWAMARVNSFLAGGPARKVDASQWKQVTKHRKK